MKKQPLLKLYRNQKGAVIGDLYIYKGQGRWWPVLATTHPATLCAALFSMGAAAFDFQSAKGSQSFGFPMQVEQLDALAELVEDTDKVQFMSGFATFSHIDFAHPDQGDTQADLHYRVATRYLPEEHVQRRPTGPEPEGFDVELARRNQTIYYPFID